MSLLVRKNKEGFTLVEIIVVLFVISVGLVGLLALITQNIQSQSYNKNNLVANQLAQEGIELIRKVRDSNWKASIPFNTSLADGDYYMDYLDNLPHLAVGNPSLFILKQDNNGFYFHNLVSASPFSGFYRQLTLKSLSAHSLRVISQVTWADHGRNYSYNLETILYDWH